MLHAGQPRRRGSLWCRRRRSIGRSEADFNPKVEEVVRGRAVEHQVIASCRAEYVPAEMVTDPRTGAAALVRSAAGAAAAAGLGRPPSAWHRLRDHRAQGGRGRAPPQRGAVPAGAEDGGGRPAGRRRRPRLQQPAHRHQRLQRRCCCDRVPASEPERRPTSARSARPASAPARLTRQLLAFSRKQVLEPQPLDLNDVVARDREDAAPADRRGHRAATALRAGAAPDQGRPRADRAGADEPGGQRPRRDAAAAARCAIETRNVDADAADPRPRRRPAGPRTCCSP